MMTTARALLAAAGVVGLVAVAPAATPIGEIVDHRDAYANQVVTVVGTVAAPSLGYLGESIYNLTQDDRRISVVSHEPAPAVGAQLQVTAKVARRPPDEEFDFPPVLVESSRQPAN